MLPDSPDRVPAHTAPEVNEEIQRKTVENVSKYAPGGPAIIQWRLESLDKEWDVERMLELNAGIFTVLGVLLTAVFGSWWLLLPLAVGAFLAQHALSGWCPPLPIFRRMGFRTRAEIDYERYALKNFRGDFAGLPSHANPDDPRSAERVLAAMQR